MYHKFLTTLLLSLIFCFGNGVERKARILGGKNAEIADYPYQASLRYRGKHFCGGAIITDRHILTAAHCFWFRDRLLKHITINTGTSCTTEEGSVHRIASYEIHPGYISSAIQSVPNDIAVITLSNPIEFDDYQRGIELPSEDVIDGVVANLTGWGLIDGYNEPTQLQKIQTKLATADNCQRLQTIPVLDSQVCSLFGKGTGACMSDSGSPLAVNGKVVGIVSWSQGYFCGMGNPDVYTKVYAFLDFINSIVKNNV